MIITTVTVCICVCSILFQAFTDFNCFLPFEQPYEMPVMILTLWKNQLRLNRLLKNEEEEEEEEDDEQKRTGRSNFLETTHLGF